MYRQIIDRFTGVVSEKCIQRLSDTAFIPFDPDNTDFVEYQKWVAEGNTPLPAEEA